MEILNIIITVLAVYSFLSTLSNISTLKLIKAELKALKESIRNEAKAREKFENGIIYWANNKTQE